MTEAAIYGVCGAGLVGIGIYGAILGRSALRRLLGFNVVGSGVFLIFGAIARRGGIAGGTASDPVAQALVITGLVVAFAATALATALLIRIAALSRDHGSTDPRPNTGDDLPASDAGAGSSRTPKGHPGAGRR